MTGSGIDWAAIHDRLAKSQTSLAGLMETDDARFDALLRERARKLAERESPALPAGETMQALVVRVGTERYGLELTKLAGVLSFGSCAPVARGPSELLGLFNAQGEIWAVFEFGRLLGAAAKEPPTGGYIVLLRHGRRRVGLRVDEVDRVRELTRTGLKDVNNNASKDSVEFITGVTSDSVILVDLDNFWTHPAIREAM
jgi:purine-binding chemotaxis protein CheW